MRKILLAAAAVGAIILPTVASAQYYTTDSYVYGQPNIVVTPGAPMAESQVYLAPGQSYGPAPGTVYQDQAIIVNGQRYYRDCWWDWGQRRCELKPWW